MTTEQIEAFNWGKEFSDLVRAYRHDRKLLAVKLQGFTGLSEEVVRKLVARVAASDKNMVAFCEAKKPLTVAQLEEVVAAKDMTYHIRFCL